MHYKTLVSILTLTSAMPSIISASALQKRHCAAGSRQFCCSVEENPDREILPNLYLFTYGLGCHKSHINPGVIIFWPKTYTISPEQISDSDNCKPGSSQPNGLCCANANTVVTYLNRKSIPKPAYFRKLTADATGQTGPFGSGFCFTNSP